MSWQNYIIHRFRRARHNLYQGDIHDSIFPFDPGLVSVFLIVEEQNQGDLRDLVSKLHFQTYRNVEIILISEDAEISKRQLSYLSGEKIEKLRHIYTDTKSLKDQGNSLCPNGEFSVWLGQECKLEMDSIERMVSTLRRRPKVDLVFFNNKESCDPLGNTFMIRSLVMWMMGDVLQPGNPPEGLSSWHQAALVLNLKTFDLSDHDQNGPRQLLDQLEISYTEKFRIQGDFYRDYYLTPWICCIQSEGLSYQSSRLLVQLKNTILKSGNFLYEERIHQQEEFTCAWIPEVFIWVVEQPNVNYPGLPELPFNTLKILINLYPGFIPESISPEWDMCFTLGEVQKKPTLLNKPFQGWIASKNISSLINILDIRIHAHYCKKILSLMYEPKQTGLKVSVVISTYHRESALRRALQSVAHQTFPLTEYEVIVVNNDPADTLVYRLVEKMRLEEFSGDPGRLRYIECPIPGLSNARNVGMSEAQGEVICFLDDDAMASENWLDQMWQAFSNNPQTGVVGGHIRLRYPQPRPALLKEGLERFWGQFLTKYDQYTEINHWMEFPWGGNWCIRRKVLLEIGGFRGSYGKRKRDLSGGEEIIASSLAQRLGYPVAIQPSAIVEHCPDPSRYTFRYLRDTITSQIIINYRMQRDLYLPKTISIAGNVRGVWRFIKNLIRIFSLPRKERESLLLEYSCYVIAWFRLLFEQMKDALARFWYG